MPSLAVTAVVPTFGKRELLLQALASFGAQTTPFAKIIVVDDGSPTPIPEATLRLPTNQGFAAAVNAGWAKVETPFVAVLNNDVELQPDWLEQIGKAFETNPNCQFATGKLFRPDGLLDGTWDTISCGAMPWRVGHGQQDSIALQQDRCIDMASFTATVWRTDLRTRVGTLDESFGSYLEDVDFSLRCMKLGCQGQYVAKARGVHLGSATAGAWSKFFVTHFTANHGRLIEKHWPAELYPQVRQSRKLWTLLALRNGRIARFPKLPRLGPLSAIDPAQLRALEAEMLAQMAEHGMDRFWRLYQNWCKRQEPGPADA